jgi:hypothetical protein
LQPVRKFPSEKTDGGYGVLLRAASRNAPARIKTIARNGCPSASLPIRLPIEKATKKMSDAPASMLIGMSSALSLPLNQ